MSYGFKILHQASEKFFTVSEHFSIHFTSACLVVYMMIFHRDLRLSKMAVVQFHHM